MGQTQPEGLALATVLSGWGTVANVMVVPLFYSLQRRLSWRIERWVWVGLLLQLSSAVLAALSWRVTLGPTSPCLYAVSFLACIGGNFQQLAVVPWVQEGAARPACVSWTMAGSNLGAVVAAIFGAIQQPGRHGDDGRLEQRFTVGTFFTAVAFVVLVGIGCMRTTPTPHHTHPAPHCTRHTRHDTSMLHLCCIHAHPRHRSAFALLVRRRRADTAAPTPAERAGHTPSLDGTTSRLDAEQNDLILRRQGSSSGSCARCCSEGPCRRGRRQLPWCAPPPRAHPPGCRLQHCARGEALTLRAHRACGRQG